MQIYSSRRNWRFFGSSMINSGPQAVARATTRKFLSKTRCYLFLDGYEVFHFSNGAGPLLRIASGSCVKLDECQLFFVEDLRIHKTKV